MLGSLLPDIRVVRNNAVTISDIRKMAPSGIVLSPGPGRPEEAGVCTEVVGKLSGTCPILGVCLGEQAIAVACGGKVGYAKRIVHGKQSVVRIDNKSLLFKGLPDQIKVARYHSLAVEENSLSGTGLTVTGKSEDGEVMAIEEEERKLYGLQFHPESVMTPQGEQILDNFISICGRHRMIAEGGEDD